VGRRLSGQGVGAPGRRLSRPAHDPLAQRLTDERGRLIADQIVGAKNFEWMIAVRTVVLDELIVAAVGAGVDTVLNLGAGMDTRTRAPPQPRRNSPRATTTAAPPTSTRSSRSAFPKAHAWSVEGRPISAPCSSTIASPY
jgi:hypothetical protein